MLLKLRLLLFLFIDHECPSEVIGTSRSARKQCFEMSGKGFQLPGDPNDKVSISWRVLL